MAMMSDSFEIASSRLALERSRNPRVLAYAQNMIQDHAHDEPGAQRRPRGLRRRR